MIRKAKQGRAAEKMRSQKGASLFLALIFFLVCALAGLAVLSTAQSYEKRMGTKAKEESEYLALLSAVEFLKVQLKLCEGEWNLNTSGMDMDAEIENKVQRELLDTIHEFCKDYINHPAKAEKEIYLTIALKDELAEDLNENQVMPDVEVCIIVEPDTKGEEQPEEQDEENSGRDSKAGMGEETEEGAEETFEEAKEYRIPIHVKAVCSLKEKSGTMSLSVRGMIICQAEQWMEVYWEEMVTGRNL